VKEMVSPRATCTWGLTVVPTCLHFLGTCSYLSVRGLQARDCWLTFLKNGYCQRWQQATLTTVIKEMRLLIFSNGVLFTVGTFASSK